MGNRGRVGVLCVLELTNKYFQAFAKGEIAP